MCEDVKITAAFCSGPRSTFQRAAYNWLNMSSALAGRTFLPCRATTTRRVRPGKAFFSGAPVAAKLRSHGAGTRKVTSMNVRVGRPIAFFWLAPPAIKRDIYCSSSSTPWVEHMPMPWWRLLRKTTAWMMSTLIWMLCNLCSMRTSRSRISFSTLS